MNFKGLFLFPWPFYCLSTYVKLVALQGYPAGCACHLGKGGPGDIGGERGSQCYQGTCLFPVLSFAQESWTPEQTSTLLSSFAPLYDSAKVRRFVCLAPPNYPLCEKIRKYSLSLHNYAGNRDCPVGLPGPCLPQMMGGCGSVPLVWSDGAKVNSLGLGLHNPSPHRWITEHLPQWLPHTARCQGKPRPAGPARLREFLFTPYFSLQC